MGITSADDVLTSLDALSEDMPSERFSVHPRVTMAVIKIRSVLHRICTRIMTFGFNYIKLGHSIHAITSRLGSRVAP
jgi:hypothetical protein